MFDQMIADYIKTNAEFDSYINNTKAPQKRRCLVQCESTCQPNVCKGAYCKSQRGR